ncbi:MAG: glycosyltransferase family 2 protein [Firmicutes bacterium]|nr:glycosyltransferase family 2 protein [Bacillota bacterium]
MEQASAALVSVIITTYHNEELLPRAIDSVLAQTYPNVEILVVDDNDPQSPSRDATEKVMLAYPTVKYLKHTCNRNGSAARNTGIAAAEGRYLAFLDNDDLYLQTHLSRCVRALAEHPDCSAVLCGVLKFRSGLCWQLVPAMQGDPARELLFSETALGTGSNLFVSADAAREIGGFDESFFRHQDVEFGLRLFSRFRAVSLPCFSILKDMGGYSNAPDFDRFLLAKQHLWETFSEQIGRLSLEEQHRYYAGQYHALLYTACQGNQKQAIALCAARIQDHRRLTGQEQLIVGLTRLRLFPCYEWLKRMAKRIGARRAYSRAAKALDTADRQTLDRVLGKH